MVASSQFTRFSRAILLSETVFNSDNLFLHVLKAITIRPLKKRKLFTTKFSQTILRNHLGFITTAAIKLCFMQRQG